MDISLNLVNPVQETTMRRLTTKDYAVDAVTAAKALLGAWLCPGRLTKALHVDRSLNREDLVSSQRLWIESDGARPKFTAAPRIGIAYASPRDQKRKWRFTVAVRHSMRKRQVAACIENGRGYK